jgi:outer membrane protein assembly factor BamB
MENGKNRTKTTLITLVLTLTLASTFIALPIVAAHDPAWNIPTYAYLSVSPDPIGVGQTVYLVFWLDQVPASAAGAGGDRWRDFTVEITTPSGSQTTLGPYTSDPVGGGWATYTPNEVGTYTFVFNFPGQVATLEGPTGIPGSPSAYIGDNYLPSSTEATLTVQEEPIPSPTTYPPTDDYWTRPIEGENTEWYKISSNYLAGSHIVGRVQTDGTAPNSPHIMWAKPISDGGVVGGTRTGQDGMTYYDGTAYEQKFTSAIIMHGRLYYNIPLSNSGSGGGYVCVDLQTGEEIYHQNMSMPTFGQLYDYESGNQHGVIANGYLWTTDENPYAAMFGLPSGPTTWNAYDPTTGGWLFNITNVPSGTDVYGQNGELLKYVLNTEGKWLALWNNTAAPGLLGGTTGSDAWQWRPVGKTVNASTAYSWNVSVPWLPDGATVVKVIHDDLILGRNGTLPSLTSSAPFTMWAISLRPESRGELLWMENYDAPPGNVSRSIRQVDPETHVFVMYDQQTMQYTGYSLDDGSYLWGPTDSEDPWNFYALTTGAFGEGASAVAYGNLYSTGYSGIVYCYDLENGDLLWTYTAYSGLATTSGTYSLLMTAIADGKVYLQSYEHSANAPHWLGSKMRCINATTGEEIWTLLGWGNSSPNAVADGYIVFLNAYDMQIYCIGKGPSETIVSAPQTAVTLGSSVMITGSVTDQTPAIAGTPAISDEDMAAWMEYLYMQKPMPEDAKGVTVKLSAIDPNGNYQDIGEVTSDIGGNFGKSWIPPVSGEYYILAEFEGSESYGSSYATTYFVVDPASSPAAPIEPEPITPAPTGSEQTAPEPTTPEPTASEPTETTEAPFITTETAILAAVAVACAIGIVNLWALRKRK